MSRSELNGPISVFAPARVDLSAGFTDVEPFCRELPGRVVNVALDIGVEVTVYDEVPPRLPDSFVDRLCAAIARHLAVTPPVIRVSRSALPAGSGLGSSGALSVALAYALSLRAGSSLEAANVVELACAAEGEAGLTGGTQDQLASMHGGAGLVQRYRDVGRRIPIDTDLAVLGERLVLVHGNGSRNSGAIIEQVLHKPRRADVLRVIDAINRVGELLAVSLTNGDYEELAGWMNESAALLRELHTEIVGNGLIEWFRELGASAAKPCGAGGPGAVWATLVDPPVRTAFEASVAARGWSVLRAAPNSLGAGPRSP
jgi:D-glycero-alpha-D-manno-heptose-7-phosphate kinase